MYEHSSYVKRVQDFRKKNPGYPHYRPLRNLSRVLLVTIALSFLSSVLQLTLGVLWQADMSANICVAVSILVGIAVFVCLAMVALSMRDWFNFLEEEQSSTSAVAADED